MKLGNAGTGSTIAALSMLAAFACATSGDHLDSDRHAPVPGEDAGPNADAGRVDDGASAPDVDAARPLACGATGFCETALPRSDRGLPLSLRNVWVVDRDDVWSVTVEGFVLHYDGTSWSTAYRTNHELYSVWATATDVWAGGEGGLLFHRGADGKWARVETNHGDPIRSIQGTSTGDVWFMSREGSVDHFDGSGLENHPIDLSGFRVTTVFGRSGYGTYAAGYVKGADSPLDHEPHLFALEPTGITERTPSLSAEKGFVPTSGAVTDAPDDGPRILIVGYDDDDAQAWLSYCALGAAGVVRSRIGYSRIDKLSAPSWSMDRPPIWSHHWDDVVVPYGIGMIYRWDGIEFARTSLDMGPSFVPRPIFGMHGDSTTVWIVGDGFALNRSAP